MPHRRQRHARQRPGAGVACYLELKAILQQRTGSRRFADRWPLEWLIQNKRNQATIIPKDAGVTLIDGFRTLLEYPWQAIANVVGRAVDLKLKVYVAASYPNPSEILIVDQASRRILIEGTQDSHKMRFQNIETLQSWMEQMADGMTKAVKEGK